MRTTHRSSLIAALLASAVLPPTGAAAKTTTAPYPTIKTLSPLKLGIGDTLTISGKNFRAGANKNTVVFKRDGGRAIFVRVTTKATKTRISIKVPAKLLPFLTQRKGSAVFTRFRVRVLAGRFGKAYTARTKSPMIGPVAISSGVKDDCDGDLIPNSKDSDDDNDLLSDTVEKQIGTDACKRDSDADGMSDGWEYQSALDRNNASAKASKPSPNSKPYANPLNKGDATVDQDGDGLTNLEEYTAWATFSGAIAATPDANGGSVLSYSGGNPTSAGRGRVSADYAYADRDLNGFLSDYERDADGDGVPNMDEGADFDKVRITKHGDQLDSDPRFYDYGVFSGFYIQKAAEFSKDDRRCAGINQVPFYCSDSLTPTRVDVQKVDPLDWLAADTDGDSINDAADDQDHDDVSNMAEYLREITALPSDRRFGHLDACFPNTDAHFCLLGSADVDGDGIANRDDADDDGDLLSDAEEAQLKTDPLLADTDGDGVSDGFEVASARDLNSAAVPYPGKAPYPNALDKDDAGEDFDQDSLTLLEEYKAWIHDGAHLPYSYSDGTQYSGGKHASPIPAMDLNGNGLESDDEKDVDHDGLTNFDEAYGRMTQSWWVSVFDRDPFNESTYPGPAYLDTSFVDGDSDGDGILDGADDQDHDGFTNAFEVDRPADWVTTYVSTVHPGTNDKARVQPFNPCKPYYSDACHAHPPVGYYPDTEDWASPVHANGP